MKTQAEWLAEYAESHQNRANQLIHKVCVPAIFLTIVGLLSLLHAPDSPAFSAALPVGAGTLIFYFLLGWGAFLPMLLLEGSSLAFFFWLNQRLGHAWAWYALVFVLAWIGQAVGHALEGKKPSFFKDLQFLLVGPLWVLRAGSGR